MDPAIQPPTQPAAPQPATPQPPIMNVVQPPKKKKTGLIVGIVAGVVALIAIIVTIVLVLVFGGGDPQKLVSDAAANAVLAKQSRVTGKITMKNDDATVVLEIKSNSYRPKSEVNIDVTIEPKSLKESFKFKLSGIYGTNGTMFVKADNLDRLLDKMLDAMIDNFSQGQPLTSTQRQQFRQAFLQAAKQSGLDLEQMVGTLNNQWIRISPDDLKQMAKDGDTECTPAHLLRQLNSDDMRQDLADALRRQPIALKKDVTIEERNGGRGFEIDLEAPAPVDSPFYDTKFVKMIQRCSKEDTKSSKNEPKSLDLVRVWVNQSTRQLTAFEMKYEDKDFSFHAELTTNMGEGDDISEPSGARSLEDISRQFNVTPRDFSNKLPLGGGRGTFSI